MSNLPGGGEGANAATGSDPGGGLMAGVSRVESSLVRWDAGQAVFRVRLTRADGAIAEAHGAADESENIEYWCLAEERALTRAAALLDSMAAVPATGAQNSASAPRIASPHSVPPAARNSGPRPDAGRASVNAPSSTPPAARRPAGGPANSPAATPRPDREAPRNGAQPSNASSPPAQPAPQPERPAAGRVDGAANARPPTPPTSADPFEPDLPEEDPFDDNGRIAPAAGTGAENSEKPAGHIRGEPGGGGQSAPDPRAPRTQPIPAATRCSQPGCSLPLTQGQVTISSRKYGQPLCTRHLKERGG